MQPSNVTDILFKQLNFRGERQKVISTNIANIDTPDFKTKELKFNDHLKNSQHESRLQLATTHAKHMSLDPQSKQGHMSIHEIEGLPEQNDGNNVNLDTQMSEMSKNSIMFNAIQSSIKKDSVWFKSVIDASSKN